MVTCTVQDIALELTIVLRSSADNATVGSRLAYASSNFPTLGEGISGMFYRFYKLVCVT